MADPALIEEGERLATITGCNGCHGPTMAGKVFLDIPKVMRLIAPNLPALAQQASDADFVRAVRHGVRRDGRSVVGMPSVGLHHLTDRDLAAIIAYIRSRPVEADGTDEVNAYRIFARLGMALGQFPLPAAEIQAGVEALPSRQSGDPAALGAYVAAISCSDCHGTDLQGNPHLPAPSLAIVRGYSREQFERLMREGLAVGGREVGLMSEVSRLHFSALTQAEVDGLYAYLSTMGAGGSD
ncbi:c-type cytochrome [Wenzhouxiangella marina]|uniref:Uncharacterized protein n=1 Tax=Wenzhouxiangella marina TaxID=1579979 RepID=A0A0K0XT43_9GAMM|nr:cytochrome c [Wenzhouxiangella marina]AKS40786.1 hypothetical protein WM2015_403 [Wenzhouxiangella marina]MBB6087659.1 mono/diheme cytochrome c family protein [Wenzhouxiangella marina]